MHRRLVAALTVLALLAAPVAADLPADTDRLVVDGQVLRDGLGRQVTLRGIAMINKRPPFLPDYGPDDFALVRSWGLNSVRLGISWAGVMPSPGEIDHAYLDRLAELAEQMAEAGLYVVVDMHQDLWGVRWENGAPEWATRSEPCPHVDWRELTGSWHANYFSPAVACAFFNFWTSDDLQAAFAATWQAVAARLADNPHVVGYDLFNEPHPGLIPPGVFENSHLYPSQARWLAAIHEVHPEAIGFFEPPVTKSVGAPTVPAVTLPEQVVYAPHLYGLWDFDASAWETRNLARASWEASVVEAAAMGVPLWLGEFGVIGDRPDADDFVATVLDWADAEQAGVAYWEYDTEYGPLAPDGTDRVVLDGLVRAYPHAVAGTVETMAYDRGERTLTLSWDQADEATTVIQAPERLYPNGLVVTGADSWSYSAGLLRLDAGPGAHDIVVAPAG